MWHRTLLILSCLLAGAGTVSADGPALSVVQPPALDQGGDGATWRYELHVRHGGPTPVTLTELSVTDGQGRPVASLAGPALMGAVNGGEKALTLPPGGSLVVYLDLPDGGVAGADRLRHVLTARTPDGKELSLSDEAVMLRRQGPVLIGPPLAGGPWVAIHSAEWPRGHRRVFYAQDGRDRIPGRFAIDFVKVAPDGTITRGDANKPADALGYGDDVLAVADARVVTARDGMAEAASIDANGKHARDDAAGNHVVLELSPGLYVFYEHLKPGSLRVKAGDHVRKGQVVGQLGFTGDSTGPHLHFHVADAGTPLGGEGLPFAIDAYRLVGRYDDLSRLGKAPWTGREPADRGADRPGPNSVVFFTK